MYLNVNKCYIVNLILIRDGHYTRRCCIVFVKKANEKFYLNGNFITNFIKKQISSLILERIYYNPGGVCIGSGFNTYAEKVNNKNIMDVVMKYLVRFGFYCIKYSIKEL